MLILRMMRIYEYLYISIKYKTNLQIRIIRKLALESKVVFLDHVAIGIIRQELRGNRDDIGNLIAEFS
jgi:hypothetical protein